jgi:hypothetical protein
LLLPAWLNGGGGVFVEFIDGFDSGGTIAQGTLFRLVVLSVLLVWFRLRSLFSDLVYHARQLNTTKLYLSLVECGRLDY